MLPSGLHVWGQINVKFRPTVMHTDTCYRQAYCTYMYGDSVTFRSTYNICMHVFNIDLSTYFGDR